MNLFTYGSLMASDIMFEVAEVQLKSLAVTLPDHQRFAVKDEHYPGMIAELGSNVTGTLYFDLPADSLIKLDEFEGEYYQRTPIEVIDPVTGDTINAMTYLFKPEFQHLLTDKVWSYQQFLDRGKILFKQQYVGFDR